MSYIVYRSLLFELDLGLLFHRLTVAVQFKKEVQKISLAHSWQGCIQNAASAEKSGLHLLLQEGESRF